MQQRRAGTAKNKVDKTKRKKKGGENKESLNDS